jgi:hypothetical protein
LERRVVEFVFLQEGVERTELAIMAELDVWHVIGNSTGLLRDL